MRHCNVDLHAVHLMVPTNYNATTFITLYLTCIIFNVTLAQQLSLLQGLVASVLSSVTVTSVVAIILQIIIHNNYETFTKCECSTDVTFLSIPTFNNVSVICC